MPAESVVHLRLNADPDRPWEGRAPLALAASTGELARRIETALQHEFAVPVGRVLPMPEGTPQTVADQLAADLKNMAGRVAMPPTTAAGFGQGAVAAPRQDWKATPLGPDPTEAAIKARAALGEAVIASFGLAPVLFAERGDGSARREALRQAHLTVLDPLVRLIEAEARRKLDEGLRFRIPLNAADLQGRARAFASLVRADMDAGQARRLAGLELEP